MLSFDNFKDVMCTVCPKFLLTWVAQLIPDQIQIAHEGMWDGQLLTLLKSEFLWHPRMPRINTESAKGN